jgi:hypothetical protein
MLKAVLHGKAGRIEQEGDVSVSWRQLFKSHEDLMTAAVFGRFSYLSTEVQNYLLQHWLGCDEDFSTFEHIEFWPTYQLNDGKQERNVEPDLVLNFAHCNLIIEVKPPAGGDQYLGQWRREIKSFLQSEQGTDKPLYFLAIGRVSNKNASDWASTLMGEFSHSSNENTDGVLSGTLKKVSALKWQPVADSVIALEKLDIANKQDVRIIKDIIEAFELYNLKTSRFKWPALVTTLRSSQLSLEHDSLSNNKPGLINSVSKNIFLHSLLTPQHKFIPLNMELISQWQIKQQ